MKKRVLIWMCVMVLGLTGCQGDASSTAPSTPTIAEDLVQYSNITMAPLWEEQREMTFAYEALAAKHEINNDQLVDLLQNTLIPSFTSYAKKVRSVSPSTPEVQAVHEWAVQAIDAQLAGYLLMQEALQAKDETLVEQANEKLKTAQNRYNDYQEAVKKVANQEGLTWESP